MIDVKVVKDFNDKYTMETFKVNDIIKDMPMDRYKELSAKGFVIEHKKKKIIE